MDTFLEQIVEVRKNTKETLSVVGIWALAILLCAVLFTFGSFLAPLSYLIVLGVVYGAYKLSSNYNIEYEYIITNGIMDIDKIINKNSRKRLASFELKTVTAVEKFNPSAYVERENITVIRGCDDKNPDAYLITIDSVKKGTVHLIFAPNERMRDAMVKFMPKFVSNSAFK